MLRTRSDASCATINYYAQINYSKMLCFILLLLLHTSLCEDRKPNFVIVLTDDQDVTLGGMVSKLGVINNLINELVN